MTPPAPVINAIRYLRGKPATLSLLALACLSVGLPWVQQHYKALTVIIAPLMVIVTDLYVAAKRSAGTPQQVLQDAADAAFAAGKLPVMVPEKGDAPAPPAVNLQPAPAASPSTCKESLQVAPPPAPVDVTVAESAKVETPVAEPAKAETPTVTASPAIPLTVADILRHANHVNASYWRFPVFPPGPIKVELVKPKRSARAKRELKKRKRK